MFRFIQNIGEFFTPGYFSEDFKEKVQAKIGYTAEDMKQLTAYFSGLKEKYFKYKRSVISRSLRPMDRIYETHQFHTALLKILGYDTETVKSYEVPFVLEEDKVVPVRYTLYKGDNPQLLIMEMQPLIKEGDDEPDGLFEQHYNVDDNSSEQRYRACQWKKVFQFDPEYSISPAVVNEAVTQLFLLKPDHRPRYILMLAGNVVFLFDAAKWHRGAYLQFDLEELFAEASIARFKDYYALFYLLTSKLALADDAQMVLMEQLEEDSYKNAYEVTKDLKEGVIHAVEALANEAIYYRKTVHHETFDETDDTFEAEMKDDCLNLIYRLLFVFYAEARTDLDILPINDAVYAKGYSLEMLRDMEQTPLNSEQTRHGYFFHESISRLFRLLSSGNNENYGREELNKSFRVRRIDSPLFDDAKLKQLQGVCFRNHIWQDIICSLSLSKQSKSKSRGRISYANLGINQLGSVYESLLAYRGFYAEEDYIEVHKAGKPEDGTFLVPASRREDFETNEILHENERIKRLPQGSFVYRLNGRDRQKSASYYTPEVLTRSTVKYTLKPILERLQTDEKFTARHLLDLKILEPAMGAAAFQNEVINQLAEAYLTARQEELNRRIEPNLFREELQKVKAYIATNNVYGVDLNPTAIELGKLSLWLNVIHRDMETPFFSNRLAVGNAVIGAWLKVYDKKEVLATTPAKGKKLVAKLWWETAPHKVGFCSTKVLRKKDEVYHFLLPDSNMLAALNIREMKAEHPIEAKRFTDWRKEWLLPIDSSMFATLQRISAKIDKLLKEYVEYQTSISRLTQNRCEVWQGGNRNEEAFIAQTYVEKEQLYNTRYRHNNAYYKLKTVMDYWCSLYFWEYADAAKLPTREQYWKDVEGILDIDIKKKQTPLSVAKPVLSKAGEQMGDLFAPKEYAVDTEEGTSYLREDGSTQSEEDAVLVDQSKEEIMAQYKDESGLFYQEESPRIPVVQRLAKRYRFFHPMLEFLEVFWLRQGFDIICGNPPWIKLEFDEQGIISEKYPEVMIRKISAPDVRKKKEAFFSNQSLASLFAGEQYEYNGSVAFMNAYSNYPLLVKQQTNLYKCVLENGFTQLSASGYMGLLHPEGIYDDPNAKPLRREVYHRLRYHFQYVNEFCLFAEVDHHTKYGSQIYGGRKEQVDFLSIHNLFHPNTIDACFVHSGMGDCGGLKVKDEHTGKYEWNTRAHKNRIVRFQEDELRVLAKTFEDSEDWTCAKLVSIHAKEVVKILRGLSTFPSTAKNSEKIITVALDETNAMNSGIMKRSTSYPNISNCEMVCSGPHIYVNNPCYKTPYSECKVNSDYDIINHLIAPEDYTARTNYTPLLTLSEYRNLIKGFVIGQNTKGEPIYDQWIEHYKLGFRKMLSQTGERTLLGAILPPNSSHTNGIISVTFRTNQNLIELTGLTSSLILDFFMKTIGSNNLYEARLSSFPLGIAPQYQSALYSRTLLLNCLNKYYAPLWKENFLPVFCQETWSQDDARLKSFSTLTKEWQWETPLRNYYERRMALIEIDVISAMALGLTLDELILIYNVQFPVLQQNEDDTWYDVNGNIVFTCSKGLTGVGVDRPVWNTIKELKAGETYLHTIEKSELYRGKQITYTAPFNKCDRVEDYKRAWPHFEKVFVQETT